jgi:branched-chain amino acid transport system permease protein
MLSLLLLLAVVVAGVTTASGAFVGGMLLMLLPVLQSTIPSLAGLEFLVIGLGAILLGRDPNGLMNVLFRGLRLAAPRVPVPGRLQFLVGRTPTPVPIEHESIPESQVAGHGLA